MAKGTWSTQYNKFVRAEESQAFDGNSSKNIVRIVYDPMGNLGAAYRDIEDKDGINVLNSEYIRSPKPISIKEYKVMFATNCLSVGFQSYGPFDWSDVGSGGNYLSEYDMSDYEFVRALKKKTFIPGQINSTTSGWQIRTIHFKAEWIQPKKGKGFWKNGVKPIVLAPNKSDTFAIGVANIDSGNNKSYYVEFELLDYAVAD
jgi:hypothetical protein